MSIEVTRDGDFEHWDDALDRSPHATPFHLADGLGVLRRHSGTKLHPLVGLKGDHVVGVLPIFEHQRGPFTFVESPPKRLEVYYLGPALMDTDQLSTRKLQRRTRSFLSACHEWIEETLDPDHTHIRMVDRFEDHRPFKEQGFDLAPYYTYVVDLTPEWDDLLMQFSRDARSNIQSTTDIDYEISIGAVEDAITIISQVADRHEEQGKPYHIDEAFIRDLFSSFSLENVKPYVCRVDEELVGGMVTLEYGDTIYRWQGGATPESELPVNDLVDGYIMQDAKERGRTRYDLVGANTVRLSQYKSKFSPELCVYHGARKRSTKAKLVSNVRRSIPIDL